MTGRELAWTEGGQTIVLSVGDADGVDRLLPAAELVKVAVGLRW